jgi:hypothetical protein
MPRNPTKNFTERMSHLKGIVCYGVKFINIKT